MPVAAEVAAVVVAAVDQPVEIARDGVVLTAVVDRAEEADQIVEGKDEVALAAEESRRGVDHEVPVRENIVALLAEANHAEAGQTAAEDLLKRVGRAVGVLQSVVALAVTVWSNEAGRSVVERTKRVVHLAEITTRGVLRETAELLRGVHLATTCLTTREVDQEALMTELVRQVTKWMQREADLVAVMQKETGPEAVKNRKRVALEV